MTENTWKKLNDEGLLTVIEDQKRRVLQMDSNLDAKKTDVAEAEARRVRESATLRDMLSTYQRRRSGTGLKVVEALYGGGCEIVFEEEEKVKHLTVKVKIDATIPSNGNSISGTMHLDLTDAKDLRDTLSVWLGDRGVFQ